MTHDFPGGSNGKESACNVGDLGLIPGLGRSPRGGHSNPLQYSCLRNSMEDIIKKFVSIFKKKGNWWMWLLYTVLQCRAHSLVLADKMHLPYIICWGYSVVVLNPVGKSLLMWLAFIPHQHTFCFHLPSLATELHGEHMFGLGEWRDDYCWAPAKSLKMNGIFSPPVFEVFLYQPDDNETVLCCA